MKKDIAKAIRIIWDSLDSHLDDTHDPVYDRVTEKEAKKAIGGRDFHRKCVKEYAYVIKVLSDLI